MASLNDVIIRLRVDGRDVDVGMDEFARKMRKVENDSRSTGKSIGDVFGSLKAGYIAASAALGVMAMGMGKAIKAASDFQEANSKMLTVFRKLPDEARKVRDELVNTYFMSNNEATKLLASTGDILTGFGMQQKEALNLSGKLNRLAADVASFTNAQGGAEAVSAALTSALLGEREAAKTYGIVITEADVKQRLAAKGMDKLTGAALKSARAQVTLEIATEQSKNAIGDLQRTQDSYANTQRRLGAATEDLATKFGAIFLPIATKVLEWGVDLLKMIDVSKVSGMLMATWTVFKEFAVRLFNTLQGIGRMIVGVVSLDMAQIKEGWKQTSDAVAEGWAEVPKKIEASLSEGERMVNEFMEGQVSASAGATEQQKKQQEALTAKQKKELEKREKQAQETRQRMWESERELQERIREERSAVAMSAQELEEERLNRMFERGELSYNAYVAELESRIAYAKIMYGKEAEIVKEMEEKKRALQRGTVKSFIGSLASLMGQYKGKNKDMFNIAKGAAIAQATINTYEGASKALSAYPPPFSFIAAAAQIAAGIAQVINIRNVGFFRGGFTGSGADTDTAGVVHRNEYVAPASQVRRNPGLFSLLNLERQGRAAMATAGNVAAAGGDNSARVAFMVSKEIGRQLQQMSWRVQLDSEGMAISMEQGNNSLNDLEY